MRRSTAALMVAGVCVLVGGLVYAGTHSFANAPAPSSEFVCPLTGEVLPCPECCPLNHEDAAKPFICPITGEELPCPKCCPLKQKQ